MSELFDWFCVIGFFCMLGVVVVGGGILAVSFIEISRTEGVEFQQRVAKLNETYLDTLFELGEQFNVYESTFQNSEPHIIAESLTEFIGLSQKWNKTAILYDIFQRRRTGFLGVLIDFNGYFWFTFNDNGVVVQASLRYVVDR